MLMLLSILSSCSFEKYDSDLLEHRWENIIEEYQGNANTVYFNESARLNLALAESDLLTSDLFNYPQAGSGGILPEWAQDYASGSLLAEIYYSMGHIAMAQRMAFETMVLSKNSQDEYMMKLLVKTNLIYGAHSVAQKYLRLIKDKQFVSQYSSILYHDEMVANDPELGQKRKCIPDKDFLSTSRGIDADLKDIIRQNTSHTATINYLGCMYLLDNEIDSFCELMDEFYGTQALPQLPKVFAQAVCMISQIKPSYWKKLGVDKAIFREYQDFLTRLQAGLDMSRFKGTYWYYIMTLNSQAQ